MYRFRMAVQDVVFYIKSIKTETSVKWLWFFFAMSMGRSVERNVQEGYLVCVYSGKSVECFQQQCMLNDKHSVNLSIYFIS